MGSHLVVIVEPCGQLLQHLERIRARMEEDITPLETFDEAFGHAVGLGIVRRREAGDQAQGLRILHRLVRRICTAIIGQPFDGVGRMSDRTEARVQQQLRALWQVKIVASWADQSF
jgi:hypothetical protein